MERLKELRKELNLTQEELGKTLCISKAAVSKIEKGVAKLTEKNIKMLCHEYNVNYSWLVNGEGEMFNTIEPALIDRLASEYDLNDIQIRMIKTILELTDDQINMFTMKFFGFEAIKKEDQ